MPSIEKSIEINVHADRLWHETAHKFDQVASWASALDNSTANTEAQSPADATVGGRVCQAPGYGEIREVFVNYDEDNLTFSYQAEGLPGFVKRMVNTWTITPLGPQRSRLTMNVNMETGGAGKILTPMMVFQLKRSLDATLDDLKVYLETGQISEAKEKANAKLARKGKPVQLPTAA